MLLYRYARGRVLSFAATASPPVGLRPLVTSQTQVETPRQESQSAPDRGKSQRRAGRSVFNNVSTRLQQSAVGTAGCTPPLLSSPDRIRNNLLKYIDSTGQEPIASTLSDIEPDPARRAWLKEVLAAENATEEDFLCWRDVASTSSLADALARSRIWEQSHAGPFRLPPWFINVLLERSQDAETVYQLILKIHGDSSAYSHSDQIALLQTMVTLACKRRFWAILPRLVDQALWCNEATEHAASSMQSHLLGFLEPITSALRAMPRPSFDATSPSGMLRRQLDRLLQAADLSCKGKVSAKYLRMLFHSKVLDQRLRNLMEHLLDGSGKTMTFQQTRACFLSAVREDDSADCQRCFDRLSSLELSVADQLKFAAILAKHKRALKSLLELAGLEESFSRDSIRISKSWTYALKVAKERGDASRVLRGIPHGHQDIGTLTALMNAHLASSRYADAKDVWQSVQQRELDVDVVALSAAVKATALSDGVHESVRLLDSWACRPSAPSGRAPRIQLDTFAVNTLLEACKRQREPDIAFRVWQAMEPRWGVQPDAYSLALLMSCAGHARDRGPDSGLSLRQAILRSFRSEQQLAEDESEEDAILDDVNTRSLYAVGNVSLLLEQSEHEPFTWRTGRSLFRQIIFSNWPHLRHQVSPLAAAPGGADAPGQRFPTTSRYAHILPDESTFDIFVQMLARHGLTTEIPVALAWMQALGVVPKQATLCVALLHLDSASGPSRPRRLAREDGQMEWAWLRDDQLLARWLQDWLGHDAVPSDDQVAQFRVSHEAAARRM